MVVNSVLTGCRRTRMGKNPLRRKRVSTNRKDT